jgi:hypothetical protein
MAGSVNVQPGGRPGFVDQIGRLVQAQPDQAGHHLALRAGQLIESGPGGQLLARRGALGGGREQAGAVADVHHRAQQAPGENRHHAPAEGLGLGPVEAGALETLSVVVIVVLL